MISDISTSSTKAGERSSGRTLVCSFTEDGMILEANQTALEVAGVTADDVLEKRFDAAPPLSHRADVTDRIGRILSLASLGETIREELPIRLAEGRIAIMDCLASPLRNRQGRITRIIGIAVEVTGEKEEQAAQLRLNRALRMLSDCNHVLTRAGADAELLGNLCQVIVDSGDYALAWIGRAEHDADRRVQPLASAGRNLEYLNEVRIGWGDDALGRGPTGRAIRSGQAEVSHDLSTDGMSGPWRMPALEAGLASSIALPFDVGEDRLTLNVYSSHTAAFDSTEADLLRELTADIAHALRALRSQQAHRRAEGQLRLFRKVLEEANDLIYLVDLDTGRILDTNAAVTRQLGYTREKLLDFRLTDVLMATGERSLDDMLRSASAPGSFLLEGRHHRADGPPFPVEISGTCVEHEDHLYLIAVARNISERLRQQAQIERLTRVLRMQAAMNAMVLRIRSRDELLTETCRLATQVGGYDRAVVSIVDPGGRTATPRFRAGAGADFPEPDTLEIRDGTEPDVCLTGRALRTGEVAICSDLTKSEPAVAMRERLIALGYRSVVALPLIVDGQRLGALTLASRDSELVREEQLRLLQDMTATLSFALRAQRQADEVHQLAFYDSVTGLACRALFCRRLDEWLRDGGTARLHPVVAALDIHQLGNINDTYGRNFGDILLQQVAGRLKRLLDNEERIGYLGGGVFVIVEPELVASAEGFISPLDRAVFAEPYSIEGRTLRITFRSGLARFPADGSAADTLVQRAEAALRHAKGTGEQYEHYVLDIHSGIADRIALEHRLQTAIDEQQFEVYYQPQFSMHSHRIESVEALLRWNDPDQGVVSPAAFLPALEASGMIVSVGNWVLQRALEDCRRWHDQGLPAMRVAVNVSALQLRRRGFVPTVLDSLRRCLGETTGFGLDLEITETAMLQDLDSATSKLQELRSAGVRIALDDFGTGYSSLGLLPRLPVDLLKIDRTFVSGLPAQRSSAALVASIIQLASAFRLVTIAEGVETPEQLGMLRQMNCGHTQGFLHSAPLSFAQMTQFLGDRR